MTQRPDACKYCTAPIVPGTNEAICCEACEFEGCQRCITAIREPVLLCDACKQEGAHRLNEKRTAQEILLHICNLVKDHPMQPFMAHHLDIYRRVHRLEALKEAAVLECPHCAAGNKPTCKVKTWFHIVKGKGGEDRSMEMCQVQRVRFAMTREES